MIWDRIRGQAQAVEQLRHSVAAGRLAHALLFVGPAGVGKRLVARALATAMLCERSSARDLGACGECGSCRMMAADMHPDFLSIGCPEGKAELPIDLLAGSADNRGREGLCHDLSMRPMVGTRRVALIEDADRMNTESSNALLKTLEEPPAYATIILIADEVERMLPTIRSRCQSVRFSTLATDEIAALVQELEWTADPAEARTVALMSSGSLAISQRLLDPALRSLRATIFEGLAASKILPRTLAKSLVEGIEQVGGETQKQRDAARWVVRFLIDFLQQALRAWCAADQHAAAPPEVVGFLARLSAEDPATADRIGVLIDRSLDTDDQLASNVSIPLCIEGLVSDVATLLESTTARL